MKKVILLIVSFSVLSLDMLAQRYEFQIITTIESIIPGGTGRSRIVHAKQAMDHTTLTKARVDGKKEKGDRVKRSDARIGDFEETKILNFYSMVGLSLENIASNDAVVVSKLNTMSQEGWDLFSVVSGVESDSGKISGKACSGGDGNGIFITRYIFRRPI